MLIGKVVAHALGGGDERVPCSSIVERAIVWWQVVEAATENLERFVEKRELLGIEWHFEMLTPPRAGCNIHSTCSRVRRQP
jgi:hypothetical protein